MKEYLLRIFNYSHWANETLLDLIAKNKISDEYIIKMMSHVMDVQAIRFPMVSGKKTPNITMWDIHSVEKLKDLNDETMEAAVLFLTKARPRIFLEKVAGKTIDGTDFLISKGDMLIHLANHAAHHRGQIVLRMRELGVTPPNIGYLQYNIAFPEFW
jgi:uncharacterized damage-inducible protein DinB